MLSRIALMLAFSVGLLGPVQAQTVGTCAPGTAEAYLSVNDVRARIFNTGGLFWRGSPHVYEVPKGEGVSAIFAATVLVGGMVEGAVRLAGSTYGPYEFWPGPLTDDGALPNPDDCTPHDRIFDLTVADILAYERTGVATDDLRDWPVALGAPVRDGDGIEGNYDLAAGDRPDLLGHQSLWWVMNDLGNQHERTGSEPLGLEIQTTAFAAFSGNPYLHRTTFYRFKLINRNAYAIESTYFGFNVDPDLGNFDDDYVGADTTLGLAFSYNADDFDEGSDGYGAAPPAVGFDFVRGPLADADGVDNDRDGTTDEPGERMGMTSFMFYNGGGGVTGDPNGFADFYNYFEGRWKDGMPITLGGDGRTFSDEPTRFMYPGDPVTGAYWSEVNADDRGTAVPPADRRFITVTGPFDLAPGGEEEIVVAIVWARGADHLDSITELRKASSKAQSTADNGFVFTDGQGLFQPALKAPALAAPVDGLIGQPDRLALHWQPTAQGFAYQVQRSTDPAFLDGVHTAETNGAPRLDLDGLALETTYFWRVRAITIRGFGPWSEVWTFTTGDLTFVLPGPLRLSDGSPAFIEVAGPGGTDPCAETFADRFGCDAVGGRLLEGRLNSTGDFLMSFRGRQGTEASIGDFAPHDFEIRFTETGSIGYEGFSDGRVMRLPFEIWDIGPTGAHGLNDPADDVQIIPLVYSESFAEKAACTFAYGEVLGEDAPVEGWAGTDRIYAYYPKTTYADWAAIIQPRLGNQGTGCPVYLSAADWIDWGRGRPLQRIVFYRNPDGDQSQSHPAEGTILRFLTTSYGRRAPTLAAPADGAAALAQPLRLRWNGQIGPTHIQMARDAAFTDVVRDLTFFRGEDAYDVVGLPSGTYFWRVRKRAGIDGPWSDAWQFSLATSVVTEGEGLPEAFALDPNYPNPFNPTTTIRFTLPQAGLVRLRVYDVLGRHVATLVEGTLPAGAHTATWHAGGLGSGVYIYRLEAGAYRATRSMTLVK